MNKRYCSSCGSPNSYIDGVAPKFCSKCGKALQFVPTEKPASQATKIVVKPGDNFNPDDIEDQINKLVMKKLNALLAKGGKVQNENDEEGDNESEITGEIPIPSANDAIVQTPKFMTIAELKSSDAPVVRQPRSKLSDYSKE